VVLALLVGAYLVLGQQHYDACVDRANANNVREPNDVLHIGPDPAKNRAAAISRCSHSPF
jgi:hypothetical protein